MIWKGITYFSIPPRAARRIATSVAIPVAMAIIDPDNPYRYLEIRGRVVEITEQGADAHIDKMAKKYLGVDKYPYRQPSETRVIYKIQPEHTSTMG